MTIPPMNSARVVTFRCRGEHALLGLITGKGTPEVANDEPLLINTPGSWVIRPEAAIAVPNLFLASDYVRNNINLATMEGANEAVRLAANAILEATGSAETPATL